MTAIKGLLIFLSLGWPHWVKAEEPQCDMFTPNYKTKTGNGSTTDCKHYLSCEEGELKRLQCPWLKSFDPTTSECWPTYLVDCDAPAAPLPAPWTAFDCKGRPNFKTNSPWGCGYYIQCSRGVLSVQKCSIWNPKFDPLTQMCRPLVLNVCQQKPFTPPKNKGA